MAIKFLIAMLYLRGNQVLGHDNSIKHNRNFVSLHQESIDAIISTGIQKL